MGVKGEDGIRETRNYSMLRRKKKRKTLKFQRLGCLAAIPEQE